MPENLVNGLSAVLAKQSDAEVRNQPPGAINGLDLQEASYQPRRELRDAVERADADEADVFV